MTKIAFSYVSGTKTEVVSSFVQTTEFVNLKNKAEGSRRYGFKLTVVRYFNPEGQVAFVPEFQTLLNGQRYQSPKRGGWFATAADAEAALHKTAKGALKRYAKLAEDPIKNKIERRD